MNEQSLLRRIPKSTKQVLLGIGDDCAIYRPRASEDLLFTTDTVIEGVHFAREEQAESVGHKALARSLSDLAAMGGTPRFCLVTLVLAAWTDQRWFDHFYRGLRKLAASTNTDIAGGDLSHADRVMCDVMACGSVPRGTALRRDGARVGDGIYVSGPLGGWKHRGAIEPRLALGKALHGKATAAIDLSDGLSLDLYRLCLASGVAAELDEIPLLPGATVEEALNSGEDYELLFTATRCLRASRIGTIVAGTPGRVSLQGKRVRPQGYDHFRK